jgi:agmatinase (EC 3.5.3.11)
MFPGATDDREAASYVVVGAPLDATTTFQPGTRFGPDQIRKFARSFDDYDHHTDQQFTELGVHDAGAVRPWDDVAAYCEHLGSHLRGVVDDDAVPLVLGGEHTVTVPAIKLSIPTSSFVWMPISISGNRTTAPSGATPVSPTAPSRRPRRRSSSARAPAQRRNGIGQTRPT